MSRPALSDPLAEIGMRLNAANAALHEDAIGDPALVPFVRMQLNRALAALDRLPVRTLSLKIVTDGGDLGRAAGQPDPPPPAPPMAGGPCEVVS